MAEYVKSAYESAKRNAVGFVTNNEQGLGSSFKMLLKVVAVALVIGFLIKHFAKNIIAAFKGPTDGTGHSSITDQLTGNYVVNENAAGGSYAPSSSATLASIRALVDQIENLLGGSTFLYYPDVVNRLANLSKTDVKKAAYYWDTKYKAGHGCGLYVFIDDEDWSGYYKPATGALKSAGCTW